VDQITGRHAMKPANDDPGCFEPGLDWLGQGLEASVARQPDDVGRIVGIALGKEPRAAEAAVGPQDQSVLRERPAAAAALAAPESRRHDRHDDEQWGEGACV
jgi:hypothetical protein